MAFYKGKDYMDVLIMHEHTVSVEIGIFGSVEHAILYLVMRCLRAPLLLPNIFNLVCPETPCNSVRCDACFFVFDSLMPPMNAPPLPIYKDDRTAKLYMLNLAEAQPQLHTPTRPSS